MSDIRKFFQGGGDSQKREDEREVRKQKERDEKRKQLQQSYDKNKRTRSAQDAWFIDYPWAKVENDELFCSVCREFPNLSDPESSLVKGVTKNYRKETLKFHDKSAKHTTCVNRQKSKLKPDETELAKAVKKIDEKNSVMYKKLFNTAYYIAKENEAFSKFPQLIELQKKNGLHIGDNYINEMSCKQFCVSTSDTIKEDTIQAIQSARYISILFDGSTDKGITEQEIVYIRYVDQKGELQTQLANIVNLEHGHASGVKDGVLKALECVGVTTDVLKRKLVGINTDGAAVNLGKRGGSVKLLKDTVNEQMGEGESCDDYVTVVHCIAHKLELAVCDSKKDIRYLANFETVLKGIFQMYYYSPKRRRELYEIATALDKELKHYGGLQTVRWVASQNRALKALLENYEVTLVHLEEITNGRDDNAPKARAYLKEMKTERFLIFLHFLVDWTNLLADVSVLFQQKKALISEVGARVRELKEKVTQMKNRRGKVLRKFLHDSADGHYKGVQITQRNRRDAEDTPVQINRDIDEILTATAFFLEERFITDLGGEPHSLFAIFDFHQWPSKETKDFRQYGQEEIEKLVTIYSPLLTDEEKENAADEWLDLKMYVSRNLNRGMVDTYESVLGNRDVESLKNILPLVNIMLTISPTTAECERGFSHMNVVKRQLRTRLHQETLSSLMRIKLDGPTLEDYSPNESVVMWLNSGRGTRHVKGHRCSGPRGPYGPKRAQSDSGSASESDA